MANDIVRRTLFLGARKVTLTKRGGKQVHLKGTPFRRIDYDEEGGSITTYGIELDKEDFESVYGETPSPTE